MIRVSNVKLDSTHLIRYIGISSLQKKKLYHIPFLIITGPIESISTIL
jgi:hypothetical protein